MWYFELRISPKPDSDSAKEAAGAFVNCWIDFRERQGAEQLAKFYLDQEGWKYEETTDAKWVQKQSYDDNPEGLKRFLEAESDSASFVIHQWPANGQNENE
jgi:TRAP-type mannitol/chloroaromatic compound transport system substrate-binding protein